MHYWNNIKLIEKIIRKQELHHKQRLANFSGPQFSGPIYLMIPQAQSRYVQKLRMLDLKSFY